MVRDGLDLPKIILSIFNKFNKIPVAFAFNYIFLLHNLSLSRDDVLVLAKSEVMNIVSIYIKFIESTGGKDQLRDQCLQEIALSLCEIAKVP